MQRIIHWGNLVKVSHTVFAMPFALSIAAIVAGKRTVRFSEVLLIVLAVLFARTAAMGWNRIVDRDVDQLNPRTQQREIPAGKISLWEARGLVIVSSIFFIFVSSLLGKTCLMLSPLVLLILFFYSYTKRVTSLSHLVLGLSLALAPGGVWVALTGTIAFDPVMMMIGVLFWVAGFDIIYSCQDIEFDRAHDLFSIPAKIGIGKSLQLSRFFHLLAVASFVLFGLVTKLGGIYFLGVGVFAAIIFSQHLIVSKNDLSRIDAAFFSRNGLGSIIFLLFTLLDRV